VGQTGHGPTLRAHVHMWHMCLCSGLWMRLDDVLLYYTRSVSDRLSGLAQYLGHWPGLQHLLVEVVGYYDPGPMPG
jgi:hypothetical protein